MTARIRNSSWVAALLAVAALTLRTGHPAGAASAAVTVEVKDFAFQPGTVTVAAGTTVTWLNDDEEPHTITSAEGVFQSKAVENAGQFTYTFTKPGVYHYFCALHPHMRADVLVR